LYGVTPQKKVTLMFITMRGSNLIYGADARGGGVKFKNITKIQSNTTQLMIFIKVYSYIVLCFGSSNEPFQIDYQEKVNNSYSKTN